MTEPVDNLKRFPDIQPHGLTYMEDFTTLGDHELAHTILQPSDYSIVTDTTPCQLCGHPHGPPFDFCRYPLNWTENDPIPDSPYTACGCQGK